jgi:hypothetical protein
VRLDDEDVGTANGLVELAVDLTVGEVAHVRRTQGHPEMLGDLGRENRMRAARVDPQRLLGDQLHRAQRPL